MPLCKAAKLSRFLKGISDVGSRRHCCGTFDIPAGFQQYHCRPRIDGESATLNVEPHFLSVYAHEAAPVSVCEGGQQIGALASEVCTRDEQ